MIELDKKPIIEIGRKFRKLGIDFKGGELEHYLRAYVFIALRTELPASDRERSVAEFILARKLHHLNYVSHLASSSDTLIFPASYEEIERQLEEDYRTFPLDDFRAYKVWEREASQPFQVSLGNTPLSFEQFAARLSDTRISFDPEHLRVFLKKYVGLVLEEDRVFDPRIKRELVRFVLEQKCKQTYEDFWETGMRMIEDVKFLNMRKFFVFSTSNSDVQMALARDYSCVPDLHSGSYSAWMRSLMRRKN